MNEKVLSGSTAVFLIALFFLPWILVSCEGTAMGEFSGYQLASGTPPQEMELFITADDMQAEPILFAVPLAGVITLALLAITLWKIDLEQNAVWGQLIVSFTALLILVLEWVQWSQQSNLQVTTLTTRPALWGSFVSLLALAAVAIFDLVRGHKKQPHYQSKLPSTPPRQPFLSPQADTLIPPSNNFLDNDLENYVSPADDFLDVDQENLETIIEEDVFIQGTDQFSYGGDIVKTEVLPFDANMETAWLIFGTDGRQIELHTDVSIGRTLDNDIVIDDTSLSSYHASIQIVNGRFHIHDLNSTNGMYIIRSGETRWQKQTKYELQDGDEIKLGRVLLQFTTSTPT